MKQRPTTEIRRGLLFQPYNNRDFKMKKLESNNKSHKINMNQTELLN